MFPLHTEGSVKTQWNEIYFASPKRRRCLLLEALEEFPAWCYNTRVPHRRFTDPFVSFFESFR